MHFFYHQLKKYINYPASPIRMYISNNIYDYTQTTIWQEIEYQDIFLIYMKIVIRNNT
jgi:hypothetical protein